MLPLILLLSIFGLFDELINAGDALDFDFQELCSSLACKSHGVSCLFSFLSFHAGLLEGVSWVCALEVGGESTSNKRLFFIDSC